MLNIKKIFLENNFLKNNFWKNNFWKNNFLQNNINIILTLLIFLLIILCLFTRLGLNFNDALINEIIFKIRLPRIILALIVGAALSTSGIVFQGLLRNPLAEPYTLGISGTVVLFVNLAIILNSNSKFLFAYNIFLGVLASVSIIYLIFLRKKYSVSQILLIGIMINIICLATVELLFYFVDYSKIYQTKFWLIGNLSGNVDFLFYFLSVFVIFAICFCYKKGDILDILSLGEVHAAFLGIDVKREQKTLFLLASFIAGISVAYAGIIGFVGLMIPHITRNFIAKNTKFLIFTNALFGSLYLLFSDFIAKNIFYPMEIPVGVITSFVGGIFFIFFIFKNGAYNYE